MDDSKKVESQMEEVLAFFNMTSFSYLLSTDNSKDFFSYSENTSMLPERTVCTEDNFGNEYIEYFINQQINHESDANVTNTIDVFELISRLERENTRLEVALENHGVTNHDILNSDDFDFELSKLQGERRFAENEHETCLQEYEDCVNEEEMLQQQLFMLRNEENEKKQKFGSLRMRTKAIKNEYFAACSDNLLALKINKKNKAMIKGYITINKEKKSKLEKLIQQFRKIFYSIGKVKSIISSRFPWFIKTRRNRKKRALEILEPIVDDCFPDDVEITSSNIQTNKKRVVDPVKSDLLEMYDLYDYK